MKRLNYLGLLFFMCLACPSFAQEKLWTEKDRQSTIEQFNRTRDELVKETENLTPAQWAFREKPDRWSIGEIVEHLALWEIIWAREISMGTRSKPQPELNQSSRPDSYYSEFIMETNPHVAADISVPTGFIKGKDNLTFFLSRREQNTAFLTKTEADMRAHFELTATPNPRNMHQVYIYQWGHVDRHLRQIRKVKADPNFPK
ncbi:DinB family protein [Dyadobacter fanqingshengii]|uniref:DinB family protein n=1 Tax=Dyadobacter fanqingshengii TaxID=2906443 RepID=A0A9X1THA0_9BACT|nr:DinB family protein [Dyadobacter fanqingshengii]MCF0041407.1 DinB family protein [Dyadobacter fanqingshengii]USJ36872.1 DinB family protein [Dyadobacter fanqingshengii]